MPRPEKVQAVADIKERLEESQAVFLAEYAGLSVAEQQALRRELRANEAEFKVVKMSLARRAAAELELDDLDELLLGPTGLAYADGDPVGAAKALGDFAKDHEAFSIKGGLLGLDFLSPERVAQLGSLDSRDVLLAKIAGVLKAPLANAAGLFAALPRNAASMMQQLLERKEQASRAVVEEAVVEEAVVEEAATEEAVVEEAVVDEAVVDEAVVDEAVVDEAVVEAESVDSAESTAESVDEAGDGESATAGLPEDDSTPSDSAEAEPEDETDAPEAAAEGDEEDD